jgi:hypothetical protein
MKRKNSMYNFPKHEEQDSMVVSKRLKWEQISLKISIVEERQNKKAKDMSNICKINRGSQNELKHVHITMYSFHELHIKQNGISDWE